MKVVIKDITRENLDDIPAPCRGCLYWEFPEDFEKLAQQKKSELAAEKKRKWFIKTLREFGNCGKIVYQNKAPVGYAQYAPLNRLPQVNSYKSRPPGQIRKGTVFSLLPIHQQRRAARKRHRHKIT